MDQQFEHLSDAQIENYGDRTGAGPNEPDRLLDRAIERHLEACDGCRTRLLHFHRARFGLMNDQVPQQTRGSADEVGNPAPKSSAPTAAPFPDSSTHRAPDCPGEDALRDLAAGLSSPDAVRLTQHAAQCDHCGPILRAYMEDFSDDLSPEDQSLLNQLNSASPSWQKKMAARMAEAVSPVLRHSASDSPSSPIQRSASEHEGVAQPPSAVRGTNNSAKSFRLPSLKWLLVPATAMATAVIAFFIWNAQRETPQKVEKLLAQAYTEQRTMEMRWPGAPYAPVRVQRSANGTPNLAEKSLLEAELAIREEMDKRPLPRQVVRLQGEAQLVTSDYRSAISTFEKALRDNPDSPELLQYLGMAHYQAAEYGAQEYRQQEYAKALEYMSAALRRNPKNVTILFNRAILNEKLSFLSQAAADWTQLLTLERDPGWRQEAETRLLNIRRKQQFGRLGAPDDRAPPAYSANAAISSSSQDPETILLQAERDTIPSIRKADDQDPAFKRAVSMAGVLRREHDDPFLQDLLVSARHSNFKKATAALAWASLQNQGGKPEDAYQSAEIARRRFRSLGSAAGRSAALFELAYSLQFQSRPQACIQRAHLSQILAQEHHYHWLEIQSSIEESTCLNMLGRLDEANTSCNRALSVASEHGFRSFYLRGLLLRAAIEQDSGQTAQALADIQAGLDEYYRGGISPVRAYSFCDLITEIARKMDEPYVRLAAALEQASFLPENRNQEVVASARLNLANIALEAGEPAISEQQSSEALRIVSTLPKTESIRWRLLEANIALARAQLTNPQKRSLALTTLQTFSDTLKTVHNRFLEQDYFTTMGEIQQANGNNTEAEVAFRRAISIAEQENIISPDVKARLLWSDHNQKPYRFLTKLLFENGQTHQALSLWEHFKSHPFRVGSPKNTSYQSRRDVQKEGVRPLNRAIPMGITITYAFVPGDILIWAQGPYGTLSKEVRISMAAFRRLTAGYLDECSHPDSPLSKLRADANTLYKLLLEPIAQNIPDRGQLYIRPDRILEDLPWEALVDNSNRYLIQGHPIVLEPAYGTVKEQVFLTSADRVLIVAPPGLVGGESEVGTVQRSSLIAKVLRGSSATTKAVEREIPRYSVFHFVGHAVQEADIPALVLADGLFYPSTIIDSANPKSRARRSFKHMKLAVLSACATAAGGYEQDAPTATLVSEFLGLGAHVVVASHWNVDSAVTSEFMRDFYKALANEHSDVAAAARRVIVDRLSHSSDSHPYYWASFTAFSR